MMTANNSSTITVAATVGATFTASATTATATGMAILLDIISKSVIQDVCIVHVTDTT